MNTELFIEGYRLDITTDIAALLNFAIDDIKDFSSRSTTWSRTIVLPGTANNNRLFGHIFQVGQSNSYDSSQPNVGYNFNAAKAAQCILFQDQLQSFKGVLRLLQINISDGFQGRAEYEVSVFGNLVGLNSSLSGALLENLDFSAYNHIYNDTNIVASWDNPGGSGYYYPLIDYGTYSTNKHDWDIKTFRPGLYAREYIDKMFTAAGYRWQSALFDTPRFKSAVVPHNAKVLTKLQSELVDVSTNQSRAYILPTVGFADPPSNGTLTTFDVVTGTGFTSDVNKQIFTYNGTVTTNVQINYNFAGNYTPSGFATFALYILKNGNILVGQNGAILVPFNISGSIIISVNPNDTIEFKMAQGASGNITDFVLTSATFSATAQGGTIPVQVNIGDMVLMNSTIPRNIRQIDFLVSIVKLFNLYVYEDKFDEKLIYITPYIDFYSHNTANSVDWTLKLNRNKVTKVKPMSELNAKIYKFKYKSDSDYYNELYRKRYNEGYGDRTYDSQFDFSQQTKEFELVFSGTPLVGYGGEDKVYSTIFKRTGSDASPTEENVDSNIRLLLTKKVTGVLSWTIKDGATTINTLTRYGYAGHLDSPDIPTTDLNFGAPKELFFILTAGSLSSNQFNVYWSGYMREITDKDSKLVTAWFKLSTVDILNLDFSKYVYVDGIAYRLNAIKDYNATKPSDCVVELFKVNAAAYTEADASSGPPDGCYLLWSDEQTLAHDDGEELLYGDCNDNPGDGEPSPPTTKYVNWSFVKTTMVGVFRIYINGTLSVFTTSASDTGQFIAVAGDTILVQVVGTSGRPKRIFVSNSVDGTINDTTSTLVTHSYSFNILADRDYNVVGEANT